MNNNIPSYIKWLWVLCIVGLVIFLSMFVVISFTKVPDTEELENPKYEQASLILADDLTEIGRWFRYNRKWVSFDQLNPHLVNALISTEDERFYGHSGIDFKGTARAVAYFGKRGGASTITQQLAKLFFTPKPGNSLTRIWQKMKEWVIAVEFEKRYTKEEILAMYLNKMDFRYDSHGIEAASNTYFGKPQSQLSKPEAALLIGMLKNPSRYNPKRFPDIANQRRNVVLSQMMKHGFVTREEFDSLKTAGSDMDKFKRQKHDEGIAPYFRSQLSKFVYRALEENNIKKADGTDYNIYRDGLKVYTTLDAKMQEHAEKAMSSHMHNLQKTYFTRWKGLDPWTYRADKKQKEIRKNKLNQLIRESERYLKMRSRILGPTVSVLLEHAPNAKMRDADIIRMLEEDKNPGHLVKLSKQDIINKKQSAAYKSVMSHEKFEQLKADWLKLTKSVRKVFNEKTDMSIFAYNSEGERQANMTPLDSIKYHRKHMQLGSVAVEPGTGYVRTWVGGIGNKFFKYDHVTSNRQVGSTFKPFLYTTLISEGTSPCQQYVDMQHGIPAKDPDFGLTKAWYPQNSDGKFSNSPMTLMEALRRSKNSISVKLMTELGTTEPVRTLVDMMGINQSKIPQYPSIALGTPELNVLEMAGAYATYANNGVYVKPVIIKRIEDKDGKTIYNAVPEQRKAINPKYNRAMVDMLKYASTAINGNFDFEIGGKTGTTNDFVDGWFVGINPELVVATWVGGEDPWIRFLSSTDGYGGVMARPYYVNMMKRISNDKDIDFNKSSTFVMPEGELVVTDCELYQQIRDLDEEAVKELEDDEFEEDF